MSENESAPLPGQARAPGPTYQEVILRDSSQPPPSFLEYSYEFVIKCYYFMLCLCSLTKTIYYFSILK